MNVNKVESAEEAERRREIDLGFNFMFTAAKILEGNEKQSHSEYCLNKKGTDMYDILARDVLCDQYKTFVQGKK